MALHADLEALVTLLPEAERRDARAKLEALPASLQDLTVKEMEKRGLRQTDYNRMADEAKQARERAQQLYDQNVDKQTRAISRIQELETTNAELERKIAAAAAGEGVDPLELSGNVAEQIKKAGYMTKAETEALIKDQAEKLAESKIKERVDVEVKQFLEVTAPKQLKFQTDMNDIQFDFRDEFGQRLNREEFVKFMIDNKIPDARQAYDKFVAPLRQKKEVEKQVQERLEEEKKKLHGHEFPGVTGPVTDRGPLMLRMQTAAKDDALFGGERAVGDGSAAAQAAAELRGEGKF